MDPRIYPGQPGLPSDSSNGDEGVNYLRRLKGEWRKAHPLMQREMAVAEHQQMRPVSR